MISWLRRRSAAVFYLAVASLCAGSGYAAPTAAAASGGGARAIAGMEEELVRRVNAIRRQHGLATLQNDAALATTARTYSCQMATERFFGHLPSDGNTLGDRVREAGKPFRVIGENLAMNVNAAAPVAAAVQGWMKSQTHRDNILREEFTETGVGICRRNARDYFTQLFLRPPS